MNVDTRNVHGVTILDLEGRLTIGVGDVALRETFVSRLEHGNRKFLVNLDKVKKIDSSGLGELIRCKATAASLSPSSAGLSRHSSSGQGNG